LNFDKKLPPDDRPDVKSSSTEFGSVTISLQSAILVLREEVGGERRVEPTG
jgi:hypothetical protein